MKNKEIIPSQIWNDDKRDNLKAFIMAEPEFKSESHVLRMQLLSIGYKIEDYILNEDDNNFQLKIADFVKLYLDELKLSHESLANVLDISVQQLHEYLQEERKLDVKFVLKLSHFTHTNPEYWYKIQDKNELIELRQEHTKNLHIYEKYDYVNLGAY